MAVVLGLARPGLVPGAASLLVLELVSATPALSPPVSLSFPMTSWLLLRSYAVSEYVNPRRAG